MDHSVVLYTVVYWYVSSPTFWERRFAFFPRIQLDNRVGTNLYGKNETFIQKPISLAKHQDLETGKKLETRENNMR